MRITDIDSPSQIKTLSVKQLEELARDIRSFLISSISHTGGHLSSNLGVVELTLAMHKVFDSPQDKMIFDVGHQCYTHKILTGRASQFPTLRKKDGLSGYQKCAESIHDPWEAGHSSTSLSAALGLAAARDLKGEKGEVIAVIGDGALTGGMALEALNDIGTQQRKVIIIFNDNNMSISKNHSGMEKRLTSLRASKAYRNMKKDVKSGLEHHNQASDAVLNSLIHVRNSLKSGLIDGGIFKEFNLDYLGPVDGHNIQALINVLEAAKDHDGPVVVHVQTVKGKGYPLAEADKVGVWHGVAPFNPATGKSLAKLPDNEKSWSAIMSGALAELAEKDKDIVAITPAMAQGSALIDFSKQFPKRFFDCGIAEEHAVTMAAGMAKGGLKPFVSIYSSFLQRAYDQISHDVARMNLPVVFGIDRAGLVGEDGDTHQGIFDISFLRTIPNVILSQPKDAQEARNLLYTGFKSGRPFFIRYPRGVMEESHAPFKEIPIGKWTTQIVGIPEQIVIAYGPDVDRIVQKAKENGLGLMVVNARFFKPIDTELMDTLLRENLPITVYETDMKTGSLSSAILEYMNERQPAFEIVGIDDHFVPHGSIRMLRKEEGISTEDLFERLESHAS
jgi:1-deoxy-D-xylulose-5-phosphate synthase